MELQNTPETHVAMVGAGIMSATLAVLLKELNPDITVTIYERLDKIAGESSAAKNNAGTGHSGFCELNYTPLLDNGEVDITKAAHVATEFEKSRDFWSYLTEKGIIKEPEKFIRSVPHMSLVWGEKDVDFLKKRWETMAENPLFEGMEFSDDPEKLKEWIPLIMNGREGERAAATRMKLGTDVNFGALTRMLIINMLVEEGFDLKVAHDVRKIKRKEDKWELKVKNLTTGHKEKVLADFVFIGAGGGALKLLEKSGIPEGDGYAGFPVSGQWLFCKNPDIIKDHHAKVYSKPRLGTPPMSVPHLDSRMIDGKPELLFGPYAGFSTKFLKNGSYWDLPKSIEWSNIKPLLSAGLHNIPLTKYLIEQVIQSKEDKMDMLREFVKDAKTEDWEERVAGQRVQVIKKDKKEGGILQFGTEIVSASDGTVSALLGASPGASTAAYIMLNLIEKCFPQNLEDWMPKLKEIFPSYNNPNADREFYRKNRKRASELLKLDY